MTFNISGGGIVNWQSQIEAWKYVFNVNGGSTLMFSGNASVGCTSTGGAPVGCLGYYSQGTSNITLGNATSTGTLLIGNFNGGVPAQIDLMYINGNGSVVDSDSGNLTLYAGAYACTYNGSTTINNGGTLLAGSDAAFGNTAAGTNGNIAFSGSGGTLYLSSALTTARSFSISQNATATIANNNLTTSGTITDNGSLVPGNASIVIGGSGTLAGYGSVTVLHTGTATGDLAAQYPLSNQMANPTANFAGQPTKPWII